MQALTEYKTLNLFISPSRLSAHLENDFQNIPHGLASVLDGSSKSPFIYETAVSPAARLIINQLTNSSYQGAMNRLFLESKSMELIVRQLYEISSCCGKCNCVRLLKGDIERIMEARNILQNSVGCPPSLDELARRVGINITKLKQGFRSVFETTPYAFLRSERMRIAENMLKDSSFNITEISHQLGFSDTSHFIREFVKFYGTTPGRFIKNHS
ncbi:MAG: AraC family transcriptional regulator [Geovibrio sp.]|nr:AraC family transcriptional regulator [Geovibrio sp.]